MTTNTSEIVLQTEKSTNVRFHKSGPEWIKTAFAAASRVAPGPTAWIAEQLFFTTHRGKPRDGERDVLKDATSFRVGRMAAWSWGEGPTVLLVHGWNGRATQLGSFVSPLVELGYRVVAFDVIGHGESPGRQMSIPAMAAGIRQVVDELGDVYGIIAHSMGGAATTVALSEGLQVERVVFVSPPSDPRVFLDIFANAIGISDDVKERVERRIAHRIGRGIADMQATTLAPSIRVPLLVIHDRNDRRVPWRSGRSIADAWPDAELVTTEGLGHHRILSTQYVTNVAVGFIDEPNRRVKTAA